MIGTPLADVRVETPAHEARILRETVAGQLLHADLGRSGLIKPGIRHEHGSAAYRGIEHLTEPPLGSHGRVFHQREDAGTEVPGALFRGEGVPFSRHLHEGRSLPGCTRTVDERTLQVGDRKAAPENAHPALAGDRGHMRDLDILQAAEFFERGDVGRCHDYRHPFLRLADSQLGTVDAAVFYRHFVEVDVETVGKLADSHAHASGAEVVALLDEPHRIGPAEQPLELPLFGGIAFLNLAAAAFERAGVMLLRRARCAAYTVTAGTAAEQQHHVARSRAFPADRGGLHSARHGPYLHTFGDISRVDDFMHLAGRKTDLVTIAGIALRRLAGNDPLGKFAGHGLGNRLPDVSGTGHAHGLVHIGAPAQRVADGAAEAGRRAAEGFYLGRMVVGFILEHEKPLLGLPVDGDVDEDAAGVVLFAHLHVCKQAFLPEVPATYRGKVHKAQRLAFAAQFGAHVQPHLEALPKFFPEPAFRHFHRAEVRGERGVAAVVAPVCVEDAEFGFGGNAAFGPEVPADFLQVGQAHGEPHFPAEFLRGSGIHVQETFQNGRSHGSGNIAEGEGAEVFLAALYGIYLIMAHLSELFFREAGGEHQQTGALDTHVRRRIQQAHAVAGGSRTLVELSGKILDGKGGCAFGKTQGSQAGLFRHNHVVGGLFGENPP